MSLVCVLSCGLCYISCCSEVLCPCSEVLCPCSEVLCPCSEVLCPCSEVLCPCSDCLRESIMVMVQKRVHCPGRYGVFSILDLFVCLGFRLVTLEG